MKAVLSQFITQLYRHPEAAHFREAGLIVANPSRREHNA
jgi:hypothetical protein